MKFSGITSKYSVGEVEIPFECVKEITRELRKTFKGMDSHSYGYCCNTCYDTYHKNINEDDYVDAKIFKHGNNNQFYNGEFVIGNKVNFRWNLTNFQLSDVLCTMRKVADKYECVVNRPVDKSVCISMTYAPTRANLYELYYELHRCDKDYEGLLDFQYFNKVVYSDIEKRNELIKMLGIYINDDFVGEV